MAAILGLPASRRWTPLLVLGVWVLLLGALGPLGAKFESVISNEPESFLPGDAESVRAAALAKQFSAGELTPAIVVASRPGGLTARDLATVNAMRQIIAKDPPAGALDPSPVIPSPGGEAALFQVPLEVTGDADALVNAVDRIREVTAESGGLTIKTTGPASFSADAISVFGDINTTLLLATGTLVIVLLLIIYRSPVFWLLPVIAIAFAETTLRAVGYLLGSNGVVINGQTQGITLVLVFGAGTDYALLLVARYREELHRHRGAREAMAVALQQAGPAVLASAGTVIAGLLVLMLAEVNGTAGLGPMGAIGVGVAAISMLTALPALLILVGRRAFWPFVPRVDEHDPGLATRGVWRRVANRVTGRARPIWIGTTVALIALAVGLVAYDDGLTSGNGFRGTVESVQGQRLLAGAFPAGSSAPTEVIVPDRDAVARARDVVAAVPGVASVGTPETGPPGARFEVTLDPEPYSAAAYDAIGRLRTALAPLDVGALVGGPTAEETDVRAAADRDTRRLPPLILLVVFVILAALLRAIVAPLMLVGTVILSYLAALGASVVVFNVLLDSPGQDPSLPLYGFVFLVALGVDYNIFLMARAREESRRFGTAEGIRRAVAVTGGVITSAGIVLAGTFSVLGVLPLWALFQVGFLVAFGVLLDTLVVRSILVPALVADLNERTWWPGHSGHLDH
ncbi:MAG: MMPL family transporter [Thermoleophilia bacterium]|nr:MMPL family transporter [Thermoleophilia bacterium]